MLLGVCSCTKGYFGPDCGNHITQAPQIEDIEGSGVCDISTGSECKCFDVQTDVLAGTFNCRRKTQMVIWMKGNAVNEKSQKIRLKGPCCTICFRFNIF